MTYLSTRRCSESKLGHSVPAVNFLVPGWFVKHGNSAPTDSVALLAQNSVEIKPLKSDGKQRKTWLKLETGLSLQRTFPNSSAKQN